MHRQRERQHKVWLITRMQRDDEVAFVRRGLRCNFLRAYIPVFWAREFHPYEFVHGNTSDIMFLHIVEN